MRLVDKTTETQVIKMLTNEIIGTIIHKKLRRVIQCRTYILQ